jgi:hypothetical protein
MVLLPLFDLKVLYELAPGGAATSKSAALVKGEAEGRRLGHHRALLQKGEQLAHGRNDQAARPDQPSRHVVFDRQPGAVGRIGRDFLNSVTPSARGQNQRKFLDFQSLSGLPWIAQLIWGAHRGHKMRCCPRFWALIGRAPAPRARAIHTGSKTASVRRSIIRTTLAEPGRIEARTHRDVPALR